MTVLTYFEKYIRHLFLYFYWNSSECWYLYGSRWKCRFLNGLLVARVREATSKRIDHKVRWRGSRGPQPFCGVATCTARYAIDKRVAEMSRCETPGRRRAKVFIKKRSPKFTRDLLQRGGTTARIMVGLFTGRRRLDRHMFDLKLAEDAIRPFFCLQREETTERISRRIGEAEISNDRINTWTANSSTTAPLSKLLGLLKQAGLDEVLWARPPAHSVCISSNLNP